LAGYGDGGNQIPEARLLAEPAGIIRRKSRTEGVRVAVR
jgi:hypothetical protein